MRVFIAVLFLVLGALGQETNSVVVAKATNEAVGVVAVTNTVVPPSLNSTTGQVRIVEITYGLWTNRSGVAVNAIRVVADTNGRTQARMLEVTASGYEYTPPDVVMGVGLGDIPRVIFYVDPGRTNLLLGLYSPY